MRPRPFFLILIPMLLLGSLPMAAAPVSAQRADPLETPLPEDILLMLADEVSGQDAFDNMVKLAGAPWLRTPEELRGETNFYESEELYRMVLAYGIETVLPALSPIPWRETSGWTVTGWPAFPATRPSSPAAPRPVKYQAV